MKFFKKLTATAAALVMTVTFAVSSTAIGTTTSAAVDDCNDDWLHAEGSRLYDADGNEVWLTGVNWFGFNCSENCLHGLWSADIDEVLSSVADHGFNCLRVPISTELLYSWMNGTPNAVQSVSSGNSEYYYINPDFSNDDGSLKNSMEIFDIIIAKCKTYGIKVILDIHSAAAHNSGHNYNLWYYDEDCSDSGNMAVMADGTEVTTEIWMETLVWIADKYSNDDTIIAYDLKNEPHGKGQEGDTAAKWDDSTDENNWAYAATECANAILKVNPNCLILIEGVEQSLRSDSFVWGQPDSESNPPYYPAWWGGNLRGVKNYPVLPESGTSQIVYSPHDYGPAVYAQTWFDGDFTTESLLDDYWYDTWAYINAEDIAPLLMGEWGGHMGSGYEDNEKWMTLLRDYMIENHINHTFWCLNPNSGDTGGLLGSDFLTWDEEKYALVEPALWQTGSGLFISLDHQYALGVNGTGISLSDFYANYATTEGSNLDGGTILSSSDVKTTTDVTTTTTVVTTTTTTTTTTAIPTDVLYGDSDVDGDVDVNDIVCLAQAVAGCRELTEQGLLNSDVDLNGKATMDDALYILRFLSDTLTLPITD